MSRKAGVHFVSQKIPVLALQQDGIAGHWADGTMLLGVSAANGNSAEALPVMAITASGAVGIAQAKAYGQSAASLALHHNTATNGALYSDVPAFVTQYQGSGLWNTAPLNTGYTGAGDIAGSAMHTHVYTVPGTEAGNASFFTKTSDAATPL